MTLFWNHHYRSTIRVCLLAALVSCQVAAQLSFEIPGTDISINFGGGDGGDGNSSSFIDWGDLDWNDIFEGAADFIGQAIENVTLPEELEDLFALPDFGNFSFIFGGNCTFCENEAIDETLRFNNVSCADWQVVSSLGIPETSNQCTLLRAAAVESCGCPAPESYTMDSRTCDVCPEGQVIGTSQAIFEDIVGFLCTDLTNLPAIDGDRTCSVVSEYSSTCKCQEVSDENAAASESSASSVISRPMCSALLAIALLLSALTGL